MEDFCLVYGTLDDLDLLVDHRLLMWKEIHPDMADRVEQSREFTSKWIRSKVSEGSLISLIVKNSEGRVVGSGCILIKEDQPRPGSSQMKYPYLLSMYTLPEYRKMGVASSIVKEAIKWSRDKGFDRISLHASDQGKSVYEKLGFQQTNEMRLKFL
ncbi:MAG: GNAT family N-acetyltransferase [Thermoplasmatales archaeon]|nr:GNAT family N-acetyltransferase [Thermoplasmatales archaeon]